MNGKVEAYWEKSKENLAVYGFARSRGHWNAAASRYYYALLLAALALLEKHKEDYSTRGNRHFLHLAIEKCLRTSGHVLDNVTRFLKESLDLRAKADYEDLPVEEHELKRVRNNCVFIWRSISKELNIC